MTEIQNCAFLLHPPVWFFAVEWQLPLVILSSKKNFAQALALTLAVDPPSKPTRSHEKCITKTGKRLPNRTARRQAKKRAKATCCECGALNFCFRVRHIWWELSTLMPSPRGNRKCSLISSLWRVFRTNPHFRRCILLAKQTTSEGEGMTEQYLVALEKTPFWTTFTIYVVLKAKNSEKSEAQMAKKAPKKPQKKHKKTTKKSSIKSRSTFGKVKFWWTLDFTNNVTRKECQEIFLGLFLGVFQHAQNSFLGKELRHYLRKCSLCAW